MDKKVGSAFIEIEAKLDKLEGKLTTEIKSIAQRSGEGFSSSFSQALGGLKGAIAGIVSIGAFVQLSKSIITLADNLEQAKNAFTTMLGSAEVAEKMLQNLSDFAAKTPFELADVRNNAKQLLAMGVSAENIIPTMKALGDTASATGADMSRLAMNYGQVITQGQLTSRELKDFQVNGVPILDELAKNAGVTTEAMQNMISAGMIGANEVTKAFETMTSEGGRFADMMYTNSSSFSGLMANMMEQLSQMGERIGTAFLPQLKMGVEGLSNAIEENSADLEMLAQSVGSTVEAMTVALRDMANDIMEIVNTLTEMIRDVFNLVSGESDETMTGVTGTWTDLFYFLQQGFTVVAGVASAIFGGLKEGFIGIKDTGTEMRYSLVGAFQSGLNGVGAVITTLTLGVVRKIETIINTAIWGLNSLINLANMSFGTRFDSFDRVDITSGLKKAQETMINNTIQGANKMKEHWNKAVTESEKTQERAQEKFNNRIDQTIEKVNNSILKRTEAVANKKSELFEKQLKNEKKQELDLLKDRQKNGEQLTKHEMDRMKRLADYVGEVNTRFTYAEEKKGEVSKKAGKQSKEALKEVKEAYKDIEKAIDDHNDEIEKAQKKVEKLTEQYEKLKNGAKDSYHEAVNGAKELHNKIVDLDEKNIESMAQSYYTLQDRLHALKRKYGAILEEVANGLSLDELKRGEITAIHGIDVENLIDYLELKKEIDFITSKLTADQLAEGEAILNLTKAQKEYQKYLEKRNELEAQKATLIEKQAIAQAFASQQELDEPEKRKVVVDVVDGALKARYKDEQDKMVEIVDFKNLQYAQDLFNKSEAIRLEQEEIQHKIDHEKAQVESLVASKIQLDQQYTKIHNAEVDKQKSKLDELINKYRELARAKAGLAGGFRAYGGEVKAGVPYLVGENFKPELFVPSTSGSVVPVNNYNQSKSYHFSGVTINSNNAQDFWSEIQNHIGDYT